MLGYTNETFEIKDASINKPVIIFDGLTTNSYFITFTFKVKRSAMKLLNLKNSNSNFLFCI